MPFDIGFNFRDTSGFVTDGTNETYVLKNDIYPTVRAGQTFGWDIIVSSVDRSASVDRRLAGLNYFASVRNFRVDLPATGTYAFHLALGDQGFAETACKIIVLDNATPLLTIGPHNPSAGSFYDATDVQYSAAAWPTSEAGVNLTFATTICFVQLAADGSHPDTLAHIRLVAVSGGTTYNVSVSESGTLADTVSCKATFASTLSEVGTLAEVESCTLLAACATAEAGTLIDVVSCVAIFAVTVGEAGAENDAASCVAIFVATVTESSACSDFVTNGSIYFISCAEAGSANDSVTGVLIAVGSASETVNTVDTLSMQYIANAVDNENMAAIDVVSASATMHVAVAEAGSLIDSVSIVSGALTARVVNLLGYDSTRKTLRGYDATRVDLVGVA
jgi:hypothetical protein